MLNVRRAIRNVLILVGRQKLRRLSLMHTVFVYRSYLLPYSETFIKEQLLAYKSWRGILVGRALLRQLDLDGAEVRLLGRPRRGFSARLYAKVQHRLRGPFWSGALREDWLTILREEKPELLHAHFGVDAVVAAPIAQALNIPMVVTLHGYDINIYREAWEKRKSRAFMRQYPGRLLDLAATDNVHFIAVSDAIKERAITFGIPADKLTTCYVGIDASKFAPGAVPLPARRPRVLFVGRLVEKKGCEYLLRAMQVVKRQVSNAELTIVGDGELRGELERLSRQLGIGAGFVGAVPPHRVRAELEAACVLCLPSVRAADGDAEGFGMVLLEAQAAGVPVVSSAFGGAKEGLVHGKTGFRFEERDVAAMAGSLVEILNNRDRAAVMGSAGREFVASRFDIHRCTERLEAYYDRVIGISRT